MDRVWVSDVSGVTAFLSVVRGAGGRMRWMEEDENGRGEVVGSCSNEVVFDREPVEMLQDRRSVTNGGSSG